MLLQDLLNGFSQLSNHTEITGLALNSRDVKPGYIFFALPGTNVHGLHYAKQAVERGAKAVVYEKAQDLKLLEHLPPHCIVVEVADLAIHLGEIAARFYGCPSSSLEVIGITGTNGKTSCSYYLAQTLDQCAVIGTLGWGFLHDVEVSLNTTPDALALQKILANLKRKQCKYAAMEVSSHGLDQGRANGIHFKGVLYTNISRDHLDYHGDMKSYVKSKLSLLKKPGIEFAVVNLDDDYAEQILSSIGPEIEVWTFSGKGKYRAEYNGVYAKNIRLNETGVIFTLCFGTACIEIETSLFGQINVENLLAVAAVLLALGISFQELATKFAGLNPVKGRLQVFKQAEKPNVVVDYAHTPDALEKILKSLRPHCKKTLRLVFGCGGDRDRGKRSQMGRIAEQFADEVVLTNDNPRNEEAETIIADILSGMTQINSSVILDRALAIESMIKRSSARDLVVVAGKGHENYQEIKGQRLPYSDIDTVQQILNR